jgi:cell division protein ZapB
VKYSNLNHPLSAIIIDECSMLESEIKTLNQRLDSLIELSNRLLAENKRLRARESTLLSERDDLQRKNELAKARVEAIILRLKALESQD